MLRAVVAIALCLVVAIPVVLALESAPQPVTAAGASAAASAASEASPKSDKPAKNNAPKVKAKEVLGARVEPITIVSISGPNLSLATADGWKRTIAVTADTKITKGGQAVTAGDLKVGDTIKLTQKRNDDGSFAITRIVVPTPAASGEVTAVTGSTFTIRKRDGSSEVIAVNGATVYMLGKAAGSMSDVTVGSKVAASGTVDGSTFTALSVKVALSRAAGDVTAKTSTTITIANRGGKTTMIHVSSSTTFRIKGKDAATIADIGIGDRVQADGVRRSDGSLDASSVTGRAPKAPKAPKAAPSASTSSG